MRLTYTQIKDQHYRNINLVGSTDANILADFKYNLGRRYQMALAKLANYRTTVDATFLTGMNVTLLSSGVAQTISSITSSSTTATATTSAAHGYSTGNSVSITGASPAAYNGTYTITVTSTTTFTYTIASAQTVTTATVSQYYPMPLGEVTIEGMYITIGAVNYPLEIVTNRLKWQQLNAILIQPTAYPRYYFPLRDTFGLWPIPQTSYTGTISYRYRDRNLLVDDVTGGTVTVTFGSNKLTGNGGVFTSAMVGRWFTVTDTTVAGQGYWYRITGYTDSNTLTLNDTWRNTTASTTSYTIGESPEVPEDLHNIFAWGTASDFYSGMRKDPVNGQLFDNLFWTGNPGNTNRKQGDSNVTAGLLGGMSSYADRDNRHVVKKKYNVDPLIGIIWGSTISS
jgi:hypothetical protein